MRIESHLRVTKIIEYINKFFLCLYVLPSTKFLGGNQNSTAKARRQFGGSPCEKSQARMAFSVQHSAAVAEVAIHKSNEKGQPDGFGHGIVPKIE